jgi:F0F1-type ATP synthase membrane subunit a
MKLLTLLLLIRIVSKSLSLYPNMRGQRVLVILYSRLIRYLENRHL